MRKETKVGLILGGTVVAAIALKAAYDASQNVGDDPYLSLHEPCPTPQNYCEPEIHCSMEGHPDLLALRALQAGGPEAPKA